MENKKFSEQDVPTILNRVTGKYEPIFGVKHTEVEKKVEQPVKIVEHVTVICPPEISSFLKKAGIDMLDLGNKEHVKLLATYHDLETCEPKVVEKVITDEEVSKEPAKEEVSTEPSKEPAKEPEKQIEKEVKKPITPKKKNTVNAKRK